MKSKYVAKIKRTIFNNKISKIQNVASKPHPSERVNNEFRMVAAHLN